MDEKLQHIDRAMSYVDQMSGIMGYVDDELRAIGVRLDQIMLRTNFEAPDRIELDSGIYELAEILHKEDEIHCDGLSFSFKMEDGVQFIQSATSAETGRYIEDANKMNEHNESLSDELKFRIADCCGLNKLYQVEFRKADSVLSGTVIKNLELYNALRMIEAAVEADPDVAVSIRQMEKEETKDE